MIAAVIVAAGQGLRMGGSQRKQYLLLGGKPVLLHTVERFLSCPDIDSIVVVLPKEEIEEGRPTLFPIPIKNEKLRFIAGGENRQSSVFNGLQVIDAQEGIVLIHDGVRPLIAESLIEAAIQGARQWEACIPAVSVTDTLKRVDENAMVNGTLSRKGLWLAQTPQAFKLSLIRSAHQQAVLHQWQATDDASIVEHMGVAVKVIPGMVENIKITTPQDMRLAEAYLAIAAKKKSTASIQE